MANPSVGILGSVSSHGGIIVTGNPLFLANGSPIAIVGAIHTCPIPGHGVNIIVTGSSMVRAAGSPVATLGSICSCGAVIISGAGTVTASL